MTNKGLYINEAAYATGGTGGANALSGLTDVSLSGVTNDDILTYSGSTWTNKPNLWIVSNSAVTLANENFNLILNNVELEQDGGALTFIDMPVTSGASNNTEESYSLNIDGSSVVRVYSQSDGTGGVKNTGLVLDGDYYYAGEPTTNGSWRWFVNIDGDLEFQKLTGGTWTYKSKFT